MKLKIFYAILLGASLSLFLVEAGATGALVWKVTSPDIPTQYLPSSISSTSNSSSATPTPTSTPTPAATESPPPSDLECIRMMCDAEGNCVCSEYGAPPPLPPYGQ